MSVNSKISRVVYQGDGKTRTFDFPFRIWKPEQARVLVSDTLTEDRDATANVTIRIDENGGSATFATPPSAGARIAILREMSFLQEDEYTRGARFDPFEVEDRLDQDCAERQQLLEALSRAVKMPATSETTPEEYQREYFAAIERTKDEATRAISAQKTSALNAINADKLEARKAADNAASSEKSAKDALTSVQKILANEIAQALRQSLNAASAAKEYAADVEEAVLEASEKAAKCLIERMERAARACQSYSSSAAQSACLSAANKEKTWLMVRNMTEKAGREAAYSILEQGRRLAKTTAANGKAAAASSAACAGYLNSLSLILKSAARKAAEEAAGEVADCLENICLTAAETSLQNARTASEQAKVCASISDSAQKTIVAFAKQAAKDAAEETAACCEEICNQLVELAFTHAKTSQANAKMALGYAKMAQQTDICLEAATRRAKDEELEERVANLEARLEALEKA